MDKLGGEKKKNKREKKSHPTWGGLFYLSLFFQISEILINLARTR